MIANKDVISQFSLSMDIKVIKYMKLLMMIHYSIKHVYELKNLNGVDSQIKVHVIRRVGVLC